MLQVFDFDRFSKHDMIGEINIPMNSIDLGQPMQQWKDLESGEKEEVRFKVCVLFKPVSCSQQISALEKNSLNMYVHSSF